MNSESQPALCITAYFLTAFKSISWTFGTRVPPPTRITLSISSWTKKIVDILTWILLHANYLFSFTVLFNNMQNSTDKMLFSLPSIKCSLGLPSLWILPSTVFLSNCAQRFDYRALGSSWKLGGHAEHLIDGSKNSFVGWALKFRVCMLLKGSVTSAIKFDVNKSLLL